MAWRRWRRGKSPTVAAVVSAVILALSSSTRVLPDSRHLYFQVAGTPTICPTTITCSWRFKKLRLTFGDPPPPLSLPFPYNPFLLLESRALTALSVVF